MEFRRLGHSGLKVPVLCFGAATFGGGDEFFKAWGATDVAEATRLVDICLEAGVNLFDTADVYSQGMSEEILGQAIAGRRDKVLISTKATFPMGDGPNDIGSGRHHLVHACEASLKRLGTDYIDIYHLHGFDALHAGRGDAGYSEHAGAKRQGTLHRLFQLLRLALMKSLAVSDRYGWSRYVAHQVYYSVIGRDYEHELMPLGIDQGVGAIIWSPLGWGRLDRQNPPRPSSAGREPPAQDRRAGSASRR